MNQLEAMQHFVNVVDTGGFAAAARKAGLGRSSVHKAVVALEKELGAQLLTRSTRKVSPTDTGLAFYDRCTAILGDVNDAFRRAGDINEAPQGKLRVNAPMSFGWLQLSPIIADFSAANPQVQLEVVLSDRFIDPQEEGFDVTIRIAAPQYSTALVTRELCHETLVACASPAYIAAHGKPTTPDALRDNHRGLIYGNSSGSNIWRFTETSSGEERNVHVAAAMWSNNGGVLLDAALAGSGIALLPRFIVEEALRRGELLPLLTGYERKPLSVFALYPRHRHLSARVTRFVDFVAERLT